MSLLEEYLDNMAAREQPELKVRDLVSKVGSDYHFDGMVVSVFHKVSGAMRYVVEDDRGMLLIFRREQLQRQT